MDGCFLDGCFLDGSFLDDCFLNGCFLDGYFLMVASQMAASGMLLKWLLLIFSLSKTPVGETGCLGNAYFLLNVCPNIQFFLSTPLFPTQSVRLPLVTYPSLWSTYVTYRTSCHSIGLHVLSTQLLLGKQRVSLGIAIILSMFLCSRTQLDCNQLNQ